MERVIRDTWTVTWSHPWEIDVTGAMRLDSLAVAEAISINSTATDIKVGGVTETVQESICIDARPDL